MQPRYGEIVALTDDFCRRHLDDEYAALAQRMTAALARKRPSPLDSGQARTWACGVLYALGQLNFLSDPATKPHMTMSDMCNAFGIGQSTASAKAALTRRALNTHRFDATWSLPSWIDQNPLIWTLQINGLVVDIRDAPRHLQELALARGLIPYLPNEPS